MQIINSGVFEENGTTITADHFGVIYPYQWFKDLETIDDAYENAGITVGAHRFFVSDFRNADGDSDVDNRLSSHIAKSHESGSLNLVLVDTQYYAGLERVAVNMAKFEVKNLLIDLASGKYGPLPDKVTIEIGNESFARTLDGELVYPKIVEAFLEAAHVAILEGHSKIDTFDFNFQGGNKEFINKQIYSHLESKGKLYLLDLVDGVVTHQLKPTDEELKLDGVIDIQDYWSSLGYDYDMNVTAWNVGVPVVLDSGKKYQPLNLSTEATDVFATEVADYENNDIGAQQGAATINVFAQLVANGVDQMHLWGLSRYSNTYVADYEKNGFEAASHGGEAFRMLSENVQGMQLLDGTVQEYVGPDGSTRSVWSQDHNTALYDSFVFEDTDKFVVFLTADDIIDSKGLRVDFQITGLVGSQSAQVEVMKTTISDYFQTLMAAENISPTDPRVKEFEAPSISTTSIDVTNGSFSYNFTDDYEVAVITIEKHLPIFCMPDPAPIPQEVLGAPSEQQQLAESFELDIALSTHEAKQAAVSEVYSEPLNSDYGVSLYEHDVFMFA